MKISNDNTVIQNFPDFWFLAQYIPKLTTRPESITEAARNLLREVKLLRNCKLTKGGQYMILALNNLIKS